MRAFKNLGDALVRLAQSVQTLLLLEDPFLLVLVEAGVANRSDQELTVTQGVLVLDFHVVFFDHRHKMVDAATPTLGLRNLRLLVDTWKSRVVLVSLTLN